MKCVNCKEEAEFVFNGCSLCDKHFEEEIKKVKVMMANGLQIINNLKEKMGIENKQTFELR